MMGKHQLVTRRETEHLQCTPQLTKHRKALVKVVISLGPSQQTSYPYHSTPHPPPFVFPILILLCYSFPNPI